MLVFSIHCHSYRELKMQWLVSLIRKMSTRLWWWCTWRCFRIPEFVLGVISNQETSSLCIGDCVKRACLSAALRIQGVPVVWISAENILHRVEDRPESNTRAVSCAVRNFQMSVCEYYESYSRTIISRPCGEIARINLQIISRVPFVVFLSDFSADRFSCKRVINGWKKI